MPSKYVVVGYCSGCAGTENAGHELRGHGRGLQADADALRERLGGQDGLRERHHRGGEHAALGANLLQVDPEARDEHEELRQLAEQHARHALRAQLVLPLDVCVPCRQVDDYTSTSVL